MTNKIILTLAALIVMASPSFAITCGDTVQGNVTLDADLNCHATHGLIVGAGNTTINMNGHTISCVGGGVEGTCQDLWDNQSQPLTAIYSYGKNNVKVLGPGTITGYGNGVSLVQGGGFVVSGLKILGPTLSIGNNPRKMGVGVFIYKAPCPISILGQDKTPSAVVANNQISGNSSGIQVGQSGCVEVSGNIIQDIARADGFSYGIVLNETSHSRVIRNSVTDVGYNRGQDSGIVLYQNTSYNVVTSNVVNRNCGNGIVKFLDGSNNNIYGNTAKYNGLAQADGSCDFVTVGKFFDLRAGGANNTWNANNVCRTQSLGIPAGVCGPNE